MSKSTLVVHLTLSAVMMLKYNASLKTVYTHSVR